MKRRVFDEKDLLIVHGHAQVRGTAREKPEKGSRAQPRQPVGASGRPPMTPASLSFTVHGSCMGFVHQTRADRWKQRPCVLRYRAWCDEVRKAAGMPRPATYLVPLRLAVRFYLPIPASWSALTKAAALGQMHRRKPDGSNLIKAIEDALVKNDQVIVQGSWEKFWDDGQGPRAEIELV